MKSKTMSIKGLSALTLLLVVAASGANAQMPVVDVTNLAQALKQVQAWKQQYNQMTSQLNEMKSQLSQAQQQYAAVTGTRNLGETLSNPSLKEVVPADLVSTYAGLNANGYSSLTPAAKSLRATSVYNCEDRVGDDKTACEAALNGTAQAQAYQENALTLLDQRSDQISNLQGHINLTQDPKAIAELQARIQIEQVNVQNDTNRITLMNALSASQQNAAQQKLKEKTLKRFSDAAISTADTFVFQMPSP